MKLQSVIFQGKTKLLGKIFEIFKSKVFKIYQIFFIRAIIMKLIAEAKLFSAIHKVVHLYRHYFVNTAS